MLLTLFPVVTSHCSYETSYCWLKSWCTKNWVLLPMNLGICLFNYHWDEFGSISIISKQKYISTEKKMIKAAQFHIKFLSKCKLELKRCVALCVLSTLYQTYLILFFKLFQQSLPFFYSLMPIMFIIKMNRLHCLSSLHVKYI